MTDQPLRHPGRECQRCDLDMHACHGCGEPVPHGPEVCGPCSKDPAARGRTGPYERIGDELVIAEPIGWREEHNAWQRFVLWLLRREHCNDREGMRRSR